MVKQNCWEFMKCGRELGGLKAEEMGVCPAATSEKDDGINSGKNAGRVCWAITGTLCKGIVQGDFAKKSVTCLTCDFLKYVKDQQGPSEFVLFGPGMRFGK